MLARQHTHTRKEKHPKGREGLHSPVPLVDHPPPEPIRLGQLLLLLLRHLTRQQHPREGRPSRPLRGLLVYVGACVVTAHLVFCLVCLGSLVWARGLLPQFLERRREIVAE